jgi:hypothetical protein
MGLSNHEGRCQTRIKHVQQISGVGTRETPRNGQGLLSLHTNISHRRLEIYNDIHQIMTSTPQTLGTGSTACKVPCQAQPAAAPGTHHPDAAVNPLRTVPDPAPSKPSPQCSKENHSRALLLDHRSELDIVPAFSIRHQTTDIRLSPIVDRSNPLRRMRPHATAGHD